jgi:hypothetical protein
MGILLGGLIGVILLILYENSQNGAPVLPGVSSAPAPSQPAASQPVSTTVQATLSSQAAALKLPQFSSLASYSIVDTSATPSFIGGQWSCPNGDIPYYDPSTGSVYCVLPGMSPTVDNGDTIEVEPEGIF